MTFFSRQRSIVTMLRMGFNRQNKQRILFKKIWLAYTVTECLRSVCFWKKFSNQIFQFVQFPFKNHSNFILNIGQRIRNLYELLLHLLALLAYLPHNPLYPTITLMMREVTRTTTLHLTGCGFLSLCISKICYSVRLQQLQGPLK